MKPFRCHIAAASIFASLIFLSVPLLLRTEGPRHAPGVHVDAGLLVIASTVLALLLFRKPARVRDLLDQYRRIETSLRDSEEKYRAVIENANEGIAVAQDDHFRFVNPKLISLTGYSREELLSKPFSHFLHPDDRELVLSRHRMRMQGEPLPPVYTFRILDRNDNLKWLEINAVRIDWDNRPAALTFLNDVTERVRAEEALRAALDALEERVTERTAELRASERHARLISQEFHALLDGIADSLMHIAPDMTVLWSNRAASRAVRRTMEATIGRRCFELWHGTAAACDACPVLACYRSGRPEQMRKTTPDGHIWEVKAYPILDDANCVASVIEIAADITEHVKLHAETARTRQLVSLGELAAGVAHEINNPLAGTALCFKELTQPDIDATSRETLIRVIDAELVKMKNIVDRLLTFSRMTVTKKTRANLNTIVESIVILCRHQFTAKNIMILADLANDLPDVLVEESKIEQVFMNIMLNALHAMEEGGRLIIRTERRTECCGISFEDTGPGIPAELFPRIFDPFFTTRAESGGTGLGLSISKEIVEQHDGFIDAENVPGRGARFTIRLPLSRHPELPQPVQAGGMIA